MLTPKQAYVKFLDSFPNSPAEYISECNNKHAYFISNAKSDDFVDDDYLIDYDTGSIRPIYYDEYMEMIRSMTEEELDKEKTWKISEL